MQAMTFNTQGIGEVLRLDSAGNVGIGTQFGASNQIWIAEPGVMNSWTVTTMHSDVAVWLEQHALRHSDVGQWPAWTLTQDLYVLFLLRWGSE